MEDCTAPTFRLLNVVVRSPLLYPKGGLKWRDNYPEGPDHPVAPESSEDGDRNIRRRNIVVVAVRG